VIGRPRLARADAPKPVSAERAGRERRKGLQGPPSCFLGVDGGRGCSFLGGIISRSDHVRPGDSKTRIRWGWPWSNAGSRLKELSGLAGPGASTAPAIFLGRPCVGPGEEDCFR